MARFLLVTASFESVTFLGETHANSHYPLGLAYLHAYLEKMGIPFTHVLAICRK